MNAAFIAAFLILGTLTLDAMAQEIDKCLHSLCNTNEDCGDPALCICSPHRGDFPGNWCSER
uniref:Putative secreted protein with RGD domain n=1 Tax=Ixodes scapularis TaxID=6945 RepID=Q4PNA5_IXOSC|nr:putative secreted protein with RGD domain [Ixodes scapularis]